MNAWTPILSAIGLLGSQAALAQTQRLSPPGSPEPAAAVHANCAGCYVQQVDVMTTPDAAAVAPTAPTCQLRANMDFLHTVLRVVRPRVDAAVAGNLVEIAKTLPRPVYEGLREEVAADFRVILAQHGAVSPFGTCLPLAALLPSGAEPRQTALGTLDRDAVFHACPNGQGACAPDGGRFLLAPTMIEEQGRRAVATVFTTVTDGVSARRLRGARMLVWFRLPPGREAHSPP